VRREQTSEVLALLKAAYPTWPLDQSAIDLWRGKLDNLSFEAAKLAVESVVEDVARFPSVADFFRHYALVREQKARDAKEEQRRLEHMAWENMPRPALNEIQDTSGVNASWFQRSQTTDEPLGLEEVGEGKCDDCGAEGRRVRLGKFSLDEGCARTRLRAGAKLAGAA
jgi:hypothetical protein